MKKVIFPGLRISEDTKRHITQAIEKYNSDKSHLVKLNQNEFRRLAYEIFSQSIIQDIPIPTQLQM